MTIRQINGRARAVWPTLFTTIFMAAVGCGPSPEERLPVFPVEGKVTVNGRPEAGVQVVLQPKDRSNPKLRPARAITDNAGNFRVTTYVEKDGASVGDYAITLQYLPLVHGDDGSAAPGPNVLPSKYQRPETSDIHFAVKEVANVIPDIQIRR